MKELSKNSNPWKNVNTLKNCDVDLLYSFDLNKGVEHKLISFALNLLCVSKKYELIFIAYGQYIYVYEMRKFMDTNYINQNNNNESNFRINFNNHDIAKNNNCFKNMNKIRYIYDEIKKEYYLKKLNVPSPVLILSPHMYSKGYVNIKCEEKEKSEKSILICVGWSEDTNIYYVQKIVECINIKKKLKNLLGRNLYNDKACEYVMNNQTNNCSLFQNYNNDPYFFLKKLKIDENNFILNIIHENECKNNYSDEFIDILQLSKNNNNFDYTKNKVKEKRSLLLHKLEEEKKKKAISSISKEKKKNWANHFLNKNSQSYLKNHFLKIKKKNLYKKNYKCILRDKKSMCNYSDKKNVDNKILKTKLKISDFYSSLESEEQDEENNNDNIEKNRKNYKKNNYNNYLDNEEKEVEEINFYRKLRNKVYIGYNLRTSLELNEKNDYMNSFRQNNQFVNEYLKSSSDENKDGNSEFTLSKYKRNRLKFYEYKNFYKSLKKTKNKKGNIYDNKKIFSNILNFKNNDNLYYHPKIYERNIKEYNGDNKQMQLKNLYKNIENYMLYIKQLNLLKEERKKFVNICKLYIKHKYYEKYSKRLETFLDPSVKIKYHNIWKQFNIFTFNLFNVDYNDKILRAVHIYLYPDIVFNNKTYIKSDTSTWAISFNFKKNLLAIGSNTHNIHIYNLNNFYYFRKRYNYDEAINYFKNTFIYKYFQVNKLFSDNKEYIFFNNYEKNKKKRKKYIKSTNYSNSYNSVKKSKYHLLNINTFIKSSESDVVLNIKKKKKSYNYSNEKTKIHNVNLVNYEKKNFVHFRVNKNRYFKENLNSYNYFSDSFFEQSKLLHNCKFKKMDNHNLDNNDYDDKFKKHLHKSNEIYKSYLIKSIKRKKGLDKSYYSDDDHIFYYNEMKNVYNDDINYSTYFNDKHNNKKKGLNYCDIRLIWKKEQKGVQHYMKKGKISHNSMKYDKNIVYVEKLATNILLKKSIIPVDLSLFFILRKENLKNILLTISYNFPNDSIVLFLKQACIGDEIHDMKWRIRYNILSTIHKMKKLYVKKFSSKRNFHLRLLDSNTLIINSKNFLKNWYLKFLRKNMFFLNYDSLSQSRSLKKNSKRKLPIDNITNDDNYAYNNCNAILKKKKRGKMESNKNKEKENKNIQRNNEKIKAICKDLFPGNTSNGEESLHEEFIYTTQKNYNMLKIEKHYVFPSSNIYKENDSENQIIHYTCMYRYKRANFILKKISKIFRNFIKNRYKNIFYNKNQLCSDEKFIYIVKNKKKRENVTNYNKVSMKYIKELRTIIKHIQSNAKGFCFHKKNMDTGKINEEGLIKNNILIICELRDHNNNLLDTIHLTNKSKEDSEDFLHDTQSDKLIENNNLYHTLNYCKDENNNKKKCIVKNNFNVQKIFSDNKITESHLSGIISNTVEMEIKNLSKNSSNTLNLEKKKSINSLSKLDYESDKSSSLPSIKNFENNIEYRTNISYNNSPVGESARHLLNAQNNEGFIQNQNHNEILRNASNSELRNNSSPIIHSIHNFRALRNTFINNAHNRSSQNYETVTYNYINDSTNINSILNESHNILNLNNRTNYMNNDMTGNINNLDNTNNIDNLNINENSLDAISLDNNSNLNMNSNNNSNINNNSTFSTGINENNNNSGIRLNLINITNLNSNTNLSSNNASTNNTPNSSEFFLNNEYMLLNILYNNILNMGIANRNFSNLLYSSSFPFNRNIRTSLHHNNSNRYVNVNIHNEVNNNNLYNQLLQNSSMLSTDKMKKPNSVKYINYKNKKNMKKESSSNSFHEIPLSIKDICEENKYDATIKNVYTLSKSADKILFTYKKNSEILFDFVIVCEGLYEEKCVTMEKVNQKEKYQKNQETIEDDEKIDQLEKGEKGLLKTKEYEKLQENVERKQGKLEQNLEKEKKENEQNFRNVNTIQENNTNEYVKSIFSPFEDSLFLGVENNFTNKNNDDNSINRNDNDENKNIQSNEIKNTNSGNLCKKKKLINLKNISYSVTSDFLESSHKSYFSSSDNFSDFNYESESHYEECAECEYLNLCLEKKKEMDFSSIYKFLKSENSLLYVENCNVSIKKNEKLVSKYCLKIKSSHTKKDFFNINTKIITLNINDFDSKYLYSEQGMIDNTENLEGNKKKILSKKKIYDSLIIKSAWIQKILLQEDYYEVEEKKQKKNNDIVEERKVKEEYKKELDDKNNSLNKMDIFKKCNLNDHNRKKEACKIKYDKNLSYTNSLKRFNKRKRKNNLSEKKIRKKFNYNVSALIHYKEKEIRNYLYDEKNINNLSNNIRKNFLNKINREYVEKVVSEIMWTFSNVIFYSADWYDILYRLFFDVSSRFYELVMKHHQHNIPCVKFSPDNNFLLSCSVDKSVVLWYPFNIENFDLDRNFNIYDHIFPHEEKKKKNVWHNSFLNNLCTNVTLTINYTNKKNVFEKLYQDTKMWQIKKEQELIKKKKKDILCKQRLKYMGWSCDFIIKKNVSKFDFLIDLFYKEKFLDGINFNYSLYFPLNYVNIGNFLSIFEKYSLFHLFRCSFLRITNNMPQNFNNFISYLYKINIKRTKYLEENKIKHVLEILTKKNINEKYNMKKIKRLYAAMKYVSKNLLKPYILIHPVIQDKYYPNHKLQLNVESLNSYPHLLTDYELSYSDESEMVLNKKLKSTSDKLNSFMEEKIKKNKVTNLYYNPSESEDSYGTNDELSSSSNEIKTKCTVNMNDDESDKSYIKRSRYEKSMFYKYIHKIRNEFSLNFLLHEEKADISKWKFIFQKLMNQYIDIKCFKDIYKYIKTKILSQYINTYEDEKPNLYFNFYITRNYNESKILKEILLNYSMYFSDKNRIHSNKVDKINKEFKLFLKLIKKQKLLSNYCNTEKLKNAKEKKKKKNLKKIKNNNHSCEYNGYTVILKNNINNLHNVIHNIINLSHENKIIKHHKYFKENNIYNNKCNNKKTKVKKDSEIIKGDKKGIRVQEDSFEGYFNDFKKYHTNFYSSDSFNSCLSDTSLRKYKKKNKKQKGINIQKTDLKKSKEKCSSVSNNLQTTSSELNKKKKIIKYSNNANRISIFEELSNMKYIKEEREKEGEINYIKKKKSGTSFINNNNALRKADLKKILQNEKKKFNVCFLNLKNENYKIAYFSNINILQTLYKYCGRGLILVNVKYIESNFQNKNFSKKKNSKKKSYLKQNNNIIFQTDIYISKLKAEKINKSNLHKSSRDIIFILKVNVEELKNYLKRKLIFEEKFINNNFYINLKVAKIIYLHTLRNCALINKNSGSCIERKVEKANKKLLKSTLTREEFVFFFGLTKNLFKKKKYALTPKNIYKYIIKMRNYVFNSKNLNVSNVARDHPLNNYEKIGLSKNQFQFSFDLFFSLLPKNKKNIVMLNISTLRFLYSHNKKKKKKVCCINKDKEIHGAIVNKAEKKQLSKYLILSADKCKLYLLKIKYTKITKNLFTTKFIPISIQTIPKEHILPSAFKTSRISLLKIIYEKSCILLANQYSNNIFIYFVHKCIYTNSYFLIPYFILPLYTEHIGKELFNCFDKDILSSENNYVLNNINYNLKKLLVTNSKEAPEESNFFIAGFDVIYVEGKDKNFELIVFAILLSNIIFSYKLKFQYY